ncbi:MAG: phosphoribosylformylglycinamidine cyclo-ligase [Verrucomicrobiota bacterium JB022]|nr:phosphoribosylformylglycinamidine cyclo-ligase [Verrucomicrobiota bacterium JB022]
MSEQPSKAYARAGVDIALADRLLDRVKPALKRATRPEALGAIGGFGGLFDISSLSQRCKHPVLVSSTDSVGTKVKVASLAKRYGNLGHDIVNHCANDVAVCGAEPLFFLDYYATSKLEERAYVELLEGLADACVAGNIALVGGETAELPGVYEENEFDLVGAVVGVVDKPKILTGDPIRPGDQLIGLSSNGLHTNGFSLARKICFQEQNWQPHTPLPGADHLTVGEALLAPHRNYAPFLQSALALFNKNERADVREGNALFGAAHITGGGFTGNIPRVLPSNVDVTVWTDSWETLPIFNALTRFGEVSYEELHEVFNMGIGMVLVVAPEALEQIKACAVEAGHHAFHIGEVTAGEGNVKLQRG